MMPPHLYVYASIWTSADPTAPAKLNLGYTPANNQEQAKSEAARVGAMNVTPDYSLYSVGVLVIDPNHVRGLITTTNRQISHS